MSIVPCDNCSSIWILYPKDSSNIPTNINYSVPSGKTMRTETVVKID